MANTEQLTKREQIAAMVLQGLTSHRDYVQEAEADRICSVSVLVADKLLLRLEQIKDGD